MKKNKKIYIYGFSIFFYLLASHLFIIVPLKTSTFLSFAEMGIWFVLVIATFIIGGFPKDNSYFKKIGIKYAIIYCLLYIMVMYLLGIFTGFSYSAYTHSFQGLFYNIFPVLIMVISREIVRYIVCRKTDGSFKQLAGFTSIFIIYDLALVAYYYDFNSPEQFFLFFCLELCSIVARNALFTFITYKVSLVPTLILALTLEIFWFVVPIIPNLGDYITSVLGILMPYYLYLKFNKTLKYHDKKQIEKRRNWIFIPPAIIAIMVIFALVAGIGNYRMIAVASNSMDPTYDRGDAVIYTKKNADEINKGDILVFNSDGKIITHRVVEIVQSGDKYRFKTKGDANEKADSELVDAEDVYGRVKYVIKYIGYPTVELQELFKNEKG